MKEMKNGKTRKHEPRRVKEAGAREGTVLLDLSFKQIAVDKGAEEILHDLNGPAAGLEARTSLPLEILNLLSTHSLDELAENPLRLSADNCEYTCGVSIIRPRTSGDMAPPLLVLHLKREVSVTHTVKQVGMDYRLTDREQEALIGISMGLTNKELAERMNVSPNTVKAFLRFIMLKMSVTTRSGVVGKLLLQNAYQPDNGQSSGLQSERMQ
jgi:DNA-binding CsgD family transcriptional regulator